MPGLNDSAAEPTWPISLQGRRVGGLAEREWGGGCSACLACVILFPSTDLPKPHLHSRACWACLACMRYSQP